MYKIRLLLNLILLLTYPSMAVSTPLHSFTVKLEEPRSFSLTSYDDILILIQEIESGSDESRYSLADLRTLTILFSGLARQGLPPEKLYELDKDLQEMAKASEITYNFAFNEEFILDPAIYYGDGKVIQCNWFSKQWRQVGNIGFKFLRVEQV